MNSTTISKYKTKSIPYLRKKAGEVFRAWIRKRDEGKPCISCGSWNTAHASHFYSAGHHPALEFEEDNVHASCVQCNKYLHGNLNEYRKRLLIRIGTERVERLDMISDYYKRHTWKHDRFFLIDIIDKYK